MELAIFVVVIVGFLLVRTTTTRRGGSGRRLHRPVQAGPKVQDAGAMARALAALQQRDPGFDQEVFLDRVAAGFVTTQYAWSEQDLLPSRPFISDGVHERFELYIAMQKAEDIRNRMRDVRVVDARIVAVTSDTHFDTIHVRFTASAISYNESLTTGRRVSGNSDRVPITFTEVWSFSRRPGIATNPRASLLQGSCPNCGDTLHIVDRAQCQTCGSIVNSGEHDWVLAEITQDSEWVVPTARQQLAGWDELTRRDPGLNVQHLEDRASVVFWRSMMAVYFDDLDHAAPVLPPDRRQLPDLWHLRDGRYWFTPAVGSVQVVGCTPARDGDPFDRVHVLIRWSATLAEGDRRSPRLLGEQRIYSHVAVLARRAGATSVPAQTFSSFSCRGCGAPLDVGKAATCSFCGTAVNDGSTSWILDDVHERR